jgi:hypothetical protein
MLRKSTTIVSGCAVLLHLALGVCVVPAHHGAISAHAGSAAGESSAIQSPCGHRHPLPAAPDRGPSHDDCHDAHCAATKAAILALPDGDATWLPCSALLADRQPQIASPATAGFSRYHPVHRAAPAVRAHLLFGVLLI